MTSMSNVAQLIIARSYKFAEVGRHNMRLKELIVELQQRNFELKSEYGNVQIFDYTKDETTDHLSVFLFDRNDFLVGSQFFSDGVRI